MSYAENAIKFMLRNEDDNWDESAKIENLNDNAGLTFVGLTQRDDQKFIGMTIPQLAELYKQDRPKAIAIIIKAYTTGYWNPLYDRLINERLAIRIFDLGVNMGVGTAVMLLEKALVDLGAKELLPDRVFDMKTVDLANKYTLDEIGIGWALDKHTDIFVRICGKMQEIAGDIASFNFAELSRDMIDLSSYSKEALGYSINNDVLKEFIGEAKSRYEAIAQKPKFSRFLRGWMNRLKRPETSV